MEYSDFNQETVERIKEVDGMLSKERSKENPNGKYITRLMFEQMLRGLFLQTESPW